MAGIILGLGFGLWSPAEAQIGLGGEVGGEMPTIPGMAEFDNATDPSSSIRLVEGLHLLPLVQLSERYDSNVFYASKNRLQGLTPEDFVTTVVPQIRGLYVDHEELVKINAVVRAIGSSYVNNTRLSYVGTNAGVVLDMSNLLSRWRPGVIWTISDTYLYSPEPPAFLVGGELGEAANPLVAGFQARRTNTSFNSLNTLVQFPLNKAVSLSGSYTNSFVNYGESEVPEAVNLISRSVQIYSAGLLKKVSLQDTMGIDFTNSQFDLNENGAFSARGGNLSWTHRFSPSVTVRGAGGVQVLSGELNGNSVDSVVAPFGSLAIRWQNPATAFLFAYQSRIAPAIQFQGATMLTHTVSAHMIQNTPFERLRGLIGANYSVANDYGSTPGTSLSWTTVRGTAGLLYWFNQKTSLTLNYAYLNVENVIGTTALAFEKHIVELSIARVFY